MSISATLERYQTALPPGHGKLWTTSDTCRMRRLYDMRYSVAEIADELKVSVERIERHLRACGIDPHPRPTKKLRKCMRCPKTFRSKGPHHRLCDKCREYSATVSPFAP